MVLRDLTGRGWGNGFPGRHIFRIDERILIGSCNKDIGKLITLMRDCRMRKKKEKAHNKC